MDLANTSQTAPPALKRALVLLSGGLDSATVLAVARQQGFQVAAISFRYGQRHAIELASAQRLALHHHIEHHAIVEIDLRAFGGSALTSATPVPKHETVAELGAGIPITYVPARNTIFLSFALAYAEVLGISDLFLGVNALDYSGYPDCRPEYITAFEKLANLATKAGVEGSSRFRIHAPLIALTKGEIIRLGQRLGVDYRLTHSCYDPDPTGLACGHCDSCLLRRRGFEEAGLVDPIPYASLPERGI